MKQLHAIYFDGTIYYVDSYDKDYDKSELELIKKGYDLDALSDEVDELNYEMYN